MNNFKLLLLSTSVLASSYLFNPTFINAQSDSKKVDDIIFMMKDLASKDHVLKSKIRESYSLKINHPADSINQVEIQYIDDSVKGKSFLIREQHDDLLFVFDDTFPFGSLNSFRHTVGRPKHLTASSHFKKMYSSKVDAYWKMVSKMYDYKH